ncbi:hypothetical protein J4772_19245 [Cohnella sp. LGH]|uniref:hypothetical protein n=1 Tax=Cohnella sp. LGH TaxID=1619153 RepID=UPI001ADA4380|nr:hypothetical protein [Cohnella sp. LGH]QTH39777.1 hypothetical protein J4772_19245 [Cohnella sp. LGH]
MVTSVTHHVFALDRHWAYVLERDKDGNAATASLYRYSRTDGKSEYVMSLPNWELPSIFGSAAIYSRHPSLEQLELEWLDMDRK